MESLIDQLRSIDYRKLPISDYNRSYIERLLPVLDYYMEIYQQGLDRMLQRCPKPIENITFVDYGGGHGFLSLLAKRCGIGTVVYLDFNPDSVTTIQCLSAHLGWGPDKILRGDAKVLRQWCDNEQVSPDIVMGMDVIEHIYCLDDCFSDLMALNPHLEMLFTTASNPFNRRIVRRLHKVMVRDEKGWANRRKGTSFEGFYRQRKDFIRRYFPDLSEERLDYWATNTRGLNYDDILRAVETESPNLLLDPFNTCDPATGSWTERILPMADYEQLVDSYGYRLEVENGFYNEHRAGMKALMSRHYNRALRKGRRRNKAPFLFLFIIPSTHN